MWIEPLQLQTWLVSVFAGKPLIFMALALLTIVGMAGFFRMNFVGLIFVVALFLIMFSGFMENYFLVLLVILGALVIGYTISRLISRG